MSYQRRIVDGVLDELFPHLAAIALEGAKGVGKTATALQRMTSTVDLVRAEQREVVAADFDYVARLPRPVLVDEWQLVPSVWDRVRRAVDEESVGEQFLLTGSAAPEPGVCIHSGAGRIIKLTMRPLAFAERNRETPTVSLATLLQGGAAALDGETSVDLPTYVDEILRSGFPGLRDLPTRARSVQLDSYVERIVQHELPENGISVRQPAVLRAWLSAYSAATGTDASYTSIRDAATAGEPNKPARATVDRYRNLLERLFILDPVPAWTPMFNPLKRLTKNPKHHLVDPALAARLLGLGEAEMLGGESALAPHPAGSWLGALFESFVTQSVRVYAEAVDARIGHLRTQGGAREVDLIVEGEGGRVVAIEVKLAAAVTDRHVRHLHWLGEQLGNRLVERIVINTGTRAYRRQDGIAVVPFALLGP